MSHDSVPSRPELLPQPAVLPPEPEIDVPQVVLAIESDAPFGRRALLGLVGKAAAVAAVAVIGAELATVEPAHAEEPPTTPPGPKPSPPGPGMAKHKRPRKSIQRSDSRFE